jgi:cytochrome c oxidase subunit 4
MPNEDSASHRDPAHGAIATTAHPSLRVYYTIFAALLILLGVTVVVAEIDLGRWQFLGFAIAASIATIKALLIMLYFMHVRYSLPLTWLVAGAGFFWLGILFVLTLSDYFTRGVTPLSN